VDQSKTRQKCLLFIMVIRIPDHSKTRQICPVFGCHLNIGPFDNWTQIDHLNTELVRFSDHFCIYFYFKTHLTQSEQRSLAREDGVISPINCENVFDRGLEGMAALLTHGKGCTPVNAVQLPPNSLPLKTVRNL
jgi:hypothetical protein